MLFILTSGSLRQEIVWNWDRSVLSNLNYAGSFAERLYSLWRLYAVVCLRYHCGPAGTVGTAGTIYSAGITYTDYTIGTAGITYTAGTDGRADITYTHSCAR